MYLVLFFIFGLVLGSFYTNLGIRLCKKESIIKPRSHCDNCNHKLKIYELIPVFSYLFLKGKCSYCKERINIVYPVLELFTAILFALAFYVFGFDINLMIALILSSLFIIVIATDLNYYIIPDSILIVTGILIFIYNILEKGLKDATIYLVYGIIMFVFMYALMLIGNAVFKKESLGGGDVKLVGVLGMIFVPMLSFISLSLGAFIALPSALYFSLKKKDNIIPFGPFIIAAFLIIFYSKVEANTIINLLTF